MNKIKAENIQCNSKIWIANKWKLIVKTSTNTNTDIILFFDDDNQVIVNKDRTFNIK